MDQETFLKTSFSFTKPMSEPRSPPKAFPSLELIFRSLKISNSYNGVKPCRAEALQTRLTVPGGSGPDAFPQIAPPPMTCCKSYCINKHLALLGPRTSGRSESGPWKRPLLPWRLLSTSSKPCLLSHLTSSSSLFSQLLSTLFQTQIQTS